MSCDKERWSMDDVDWVVVKATAQARVTRRAISRAQPFLHVRTLECLRVRSKYSSYSKLILSLGNSPIIRSDCFCLLTILFEHLDTSTFMDQCPIRGHSNHDDFRVEWYTLHVSQLNEVIVDVQKYRSRHQVEAKGKENHKKHPDHAETRTSC